MKNREYYPIIIVTNLPSFYKINLYNGINSHKRIFVIFTGDTVDIRKTDFFSGNIEFDHISLQEYGKYDRIFKARKIISSMSYDELIISGLNEPIHWYLAFCYPKSKNAMVVESSYYESPTTGLKGFLKRQFFKRIAKTYASGVAQHKLVDALKFKGRVVITKGVGVFNIIPQPPYTPRPKVTSFIYVGRLSAEKNLKFLIEVFNELPQYSLNIVGYGPLDAELKAIARANILFHGAVDNTKLSEYYQRSDVFILPSIREPWGLVVEEALNNGLPVLLSNRVGCIDQIIDDKNGVVFDFDSKESLGEAIVKITEPDFHNNLRLNISKLDFNRIAAEQIEYYL